MTRTERAQPASTARYNRKKEAIIAAAAGILNRHGVRGMTLADVAAGVGLITTSVTYYFKKKEDLALACYLRAIECYDALISDALQKPDPQAQLAALLENFFRLDRRIREGKEPPLATFSDLRSLHEPHLSMVNTAYSQMFRKVRTLFQEPGQSQSARRMATARAHMLMEQLYLSAVWLPRFEVEDYPRVCARMLDILRHGIADENMQWAPEPLAEIDRITHGEPESARETFLVSATRLINQLGYRGASVEKISEQLNVTKGSFYHHNDAKDDLVVACFLRSFAIVRQAQTLAMAMGGTLCAQIAAAAASLAEFQMSERGPLLRTSSLSALPELIRYDMMDQAVRVTGRFSGMISDGVAEGSLRPVDPLIAAQMLNASLNASSAAPLVIPKIEPDEIAAFYIKPVLMGMFAA